MAVFPPTSNGKWVGNGMQPYVYDCVACPSQHGPACMHILRHGAYLSPDSLELWITHRPCGAVHGLHELVCYGRTGGTAKARY